MYYSEYFSVLCTFFINIFLVSVKCQKHYNVRDEALLLYNMDLERAVLRFRDSPEYLKILEDKKQETDKFIQETFVFLYQGYKAKLQNRIRKDFPLEKLVGKAETTTTKDSNSINKYIFRKMANSTNFFFRIVNGKIMRRQKSMSNELELREEIRPLEKYSKRHSPLKLHERNHYKDLGFNYSKGLIEGLMNALGDKKKEIIAASWAVVASPDQHDKHDTNKHATPSTSEYTKPTSEHTTPTISTTEHTTTTTTEEPTTSTTEEPTTTTTEEPTTTTTESTTPSTTEEIMTTTNECEPSTKRTTMDIWSYTCGPNSNGLRCGSSPNAATPAKEASTGSTELEVPETTTTEFPSQEDHQVSLETTKNNSPVTATTKSGRRYGRANRGITNDKHYYPRNIPKFRKKFQEFSDFDSQFNYVKRPVIQRNLLSRQDFFTQKDTISKELSTKASKNQNLLSSKNGRRLDQYQYMWSSREQAIASYRSLQDIMQKFDADRNEENKRTESKVSLNFRNYQKKVTAAAKPHNIKSKKALLKNEKDLSILSNEENYEDLGQKKSESKKHEKSSDNKNIVNNKWQQVEPYEDNTIEDVTSKSLKLEWKYAGDIRNKNDIMMKANWDYDPRENPKVVYKILDKHSSEGKTVNGNKHNTKQNSVYRNNKHNRHLSGDDTEYNSLHEENNDKNEILKTPDANSNLVKKDKPKRIIIWDGRYTNSKDKSYSLLDRIDKRDLLLDEDTLSKLNGNKRINSMINEIWKQGFKQRNHKNLWDNRAILDPIRGQTKNPNTYRRKSKNSDEKLKEPSNGAVRNKKDNEEHEINFSNSHEKWSQLVRNSWSSKQIS